ncbi:MAG: transposase [Chloroflexi bacterium]|nr:transposase [Chloroflexota bacterium]
MLNQSKTFRHKSIRLRGYDYTSPGSYFITICTYAHQCIFGEIIGDEMRFNTLGKIAQVEWSKTGAIRRNVTVDACIVMPNHLHGILAMQDDSVGAQQPTAAEEEFGKPASNSVPTIVRSFKAATTKQINEVRHAPQVPVWQRNYYEHIIRTERELEQIREYIVHNAQKWNLDKENPVNLKSG